MMVLNSVLKNASTLESERYGLLATLEDENALLNIKGIKVKSLRGLLFHGELFWSSFKDEMIFLSPISTLNLTFFVFCFFIKIWISAYILLLWFLIYLVHEKWAEWWIRKSATIFSFLTKLKMLHNQSNFLNFLSSGIKTHNNIM